MFLLILIEGVAQFKNLFNHEIAFVTFVASQWPNIAVIANEVKQSPIQTFYLRLLRRYTPRNDCIIVFASVNEAIS